MLQNPIQVLKEMITYEQRRPAIKSQQIDSKNL